MSISKIGVLGAGTMGGGIAQVAAQSGYEVVLVDIEDSFVKKGMARIEASLDKAIKKGKLTEEQKKETLGCIKPSINYQDLADADLVIEAIIEDIELKKKAFSELDRICKPETLLVSNTSSMSINMIASATKRPDRVCGMHFFNPAPIMKLVEVVWGYSTSEETIKTVIETAKKMGKTTVEVKKDYPGFIVTRVNMAQVIEAVRLVDEGVATPEDIDTAMKLGLNWPMGPFELQDFMGIDVTCFILDYFYEEFKDMRWNIPQSLKALLRAGKMGRKSKAGWFNYSLN